MKIVRSPKAKTNVAVLPEQIQHRIIYLRNQKVMLDVDLADLYGVETKALNRAVGRNIERFPEDFMFKLTPMEFEILRYHFGTSNPNSKFATSNKMRGGRRYRPYAFTEQGVAMLSSVLRSKRAAMVNLGIMRAFVSLRQMLISHRSLARKLTAMEKRYDAQFKVVFDAIRELMAPPMQPRRRIGF
jgi:ORF6N domain-containing protein